MSTHILQSQHPTLALGKEVGYPTRYNPELLLPISRALGRASLTEQTPSAAPTGERGALGRPHQAAIALPFTGWDMWRGYELSWLDMRGLPQVGILKVWVPCTSTHIIESKSFKLYLNSLNNERMSNTESVHARIEEDLSSRVGASVKVEIVPPSKFAQEHIDEPAQGCIDDQPIEIDRYHPDSGLLVCNAQRIVTERLFSRLLKSNCPVTGQPDWASVHIAYTGSAIDRASLLRYIVSYRQHEGFHEQCVEQIFCDLMRRCQLQQLSVYARYTRRGGMDINPWRATPGSPEPTNDRSAQQ